MISASKLDSILEELTGNIDGLNSQRIVVDDEHFAKQVNDMYVDEFPCVLGVIPDTKVTSRSLDDQKFSNSLLFFFVIKVDQKKRTQELTRAVYDETLALVDSFFGQVYSSPAGAPCKLLSRIEWDSIEIKPEYNFASCDGYSVAFRLETNKLN